MEFLISQLTHPVYVTVAAICMAALVVRSRRQELPKEYATLRCTAFWLYWTCSYLGAAALLDAESLAGYVLQLAIAAAFTVVCSIIARKPYVWFRQVMPTRTRSHQVAARLLATHAIFWRSFETLPADTHLQLLNHRTGLDLPHPFIHQLGDMANYKRWLHIQTRANIAYCATAGLTGAADELDAKVLQLSKSIQKKAPAGTDFSEKEMQAINQAQSFVTANTDSIEAIARALIGRLALDQRSLSALLAKVQLTEGIPEIIFEPLVNDGGIAATA